MIPLNISCNNCGNLLEVNHIVNYVTCNNCNTLLEIIKTETSYFTIEKEGTTNNKSRNATEQNKEKNTSQLYAEIEMLDREWNNNLPNFMVKGTLPDTEGTLTSFMGIFAIIFGIIWTIAAGSMFPPFIIFGIVFVITGIWNLVNHSNRRVTFLDAKKEYEKRRNELQLKIKK